MKKFTRSLRQLKIAAIATWLLTMFVGTLPMNIALRYIEMGPLAILLLILVGLVGGYLAVVVKRIYDEKYDELCEHTAIEMYVEELLPDCSGEELPEDYDFETLLERPFKD